MLVHDRSVLLQSLFLELSQLEGTVVIMAGHFSLVPSSSGGDLVPGIWQELPDDLRIRVREHPYMGDFPLLTWELGLDLAILLKNAGRDARLLLLVNDWQHTLPAPHGQPNAARVRFFQNALIPNSFRRRLEIAGLSEDLILRQNPYDAAPLWSEIKLRRKYVRYKDRVRAESSCAQEWIPLLAELEDRGVRQFVAFVPGMCRVPVIGGTERVEETLELQMRTILVFPGAKEDFWEDTWIER